MSRFNGAEPVRRSTIDAFSSAFRDLASAAKRSSLLRLAEGTLAVSGGAKAAAPILRGFRASGWERHQAIPSGDDAAGRAVARRLRPADEVTRSSS